jgi:uncharacterized protein (TIGR00297 family)
VKDVEMQREPIWRKAIPKGRDRLQSLLLAWISGILLLGLTIWTLRLAFQLPPRFPAFLATVVAISGAFAVTVWLLKAATPIAAACGGMICLLLTFWTASSSPSVLHTALTPLAGLFALTFLTTRAGRQRKTSAGLAEARKSRSASQVVANISAAALCVAPWAPSHAGILKAMCLAALAEATADTVSSEIGQAFGGTPFMVTTMRRANPGIDGAITPMGTLAGIAACSLVVISGAWSMHLPTEYAVISLTAGIAGLFFDSLLGATLEQRGWLGNDLVNFSSTAFAAALAALLCRHFAL